MTHKPVLYALLALAAALGGGWGQAAPAQADSSAGLTSTVNSIADAPDANPGNGVCETASGNGVCTLRAALMESNALPGADTVVLPAHAQPYLLTGALTINSDLTLTGGGAANTIIDGNGSATQDRVLNTVNATIAISGVTLRNGRTSDRGGGIFNYAAYLTLTNVVVRENRASGGGRIWAGGVVMLVNSTVTQNKAGYGGGLTNPTAATLTLIGSTVSGNEANGALCGCSGGGGGLDLQGSANLVNSTLSGNITDERGGGLSTYGVVHLYNVTVTNNTAANDGGGVEVGAGSNTAVWVQNTIIAGNFRGSQSDDCLGTLASAGYNLLGNNAGCTGLTNGVNGDKVGTSANPLSAVLGPLANNGGFTQTHALVPQVGVFPGSPGIDAGNPAGCANHVGALLASDQRANMRQLDGDHDGQARCDMGAFEFGTPFTVYVPLTVK